MKNYYFLLLILTTLLSSCGKPNKKAIVDDFFMALEKGDFERAKALRTPETAKILLVVEKEYAANKDKIKDPTPIKIEYLEEKEDPKSPSYTVNITIGTVVKKIIIPLVLVEERWVISIPPRDISILHFVVFCNQYHIIFVNPSIHFHGKTKKYTKKKTKKKHKH